MHMSRSTALTRYLFGATCILAIIFLVRCTPAKTEEQNSDSTQVQSDSLPVTVDSLVQDPPAVNTTSSLDTISIADVPPDSLYSDDSLSRYFTPEQIVTLKQARKQFKNIRSAADVAGYFPATLKTVSDILNTQINKITPTETSGDDSPNATWEWFPNYFPGIYGSVDCSECSYEAHIDLSPLVQKVSATPEKEDDLFFDLTQSVYGGTPTIDGSIENSGGYYELVGCDFCAASLLGSGKRVEILQKLALAASARPLFGAQMDRYLEVALGVQEDRFYYPKKDVLTELDKMMRSVVITDAQRASLSEFRKRLASGGGDYQFGCGTADCKWPEY